jgi:hypothetical protein
MLEAGQDMRIGVEGDRRPRVPESLAHDFERPAVQEQERRVRVAQIVEASGLHRRRVAVGDIPGSHSTIANAMA